MPAWYDWVTRQAYPYDDHAQRQVIDHLCSILRTRLLDSKAPTPSSQPASHPGRDETALALKRVADVTARLWRRTYYPLVFPIRVPEPGQQGPSSGRHEAAAGGPPPPDEDVGWRSRPLEARRPPILAWTGPPWSEVEPFKGEAAGPKGQAAGSLLAADGALATAALAGALVRPYLEGTSFEEVRLAFLLLPLRAKLDEILGPWQQEKERVARLMDWWLGDDSLEPAWLPDEALRRLAWLRSPGQLPDPHGPSAHEHPTIGLVQVGAHQIKRFVFESSALPDIRGGSMLLDEAPRRLERFVAELLGPEAVIRQEASFFTCLLPDRPPRMELAAPESDEGPATVVVERLDEWVDFLAAHYQSRVRSARVFAVCATQPLQTLLYHYHDVVKALLQAESRTRVEGRAPQFERLPFEQPCHFCRARPAEMQTFMPEDVDAVPVPTCRVCDLKVQTGRRGRRIKTLAIWNWDTHPPDEPAPDPEPSRGLDDSAPIFGSYRRAKTLDDLVPQRVERRLLASVFGDGNQFGALVSSAPSLAHYLHWAHRVAATVNGVACLAMKQAMAHPSVRAGLNRSDEPAAFPLEILAAGGDDFNLFAWAPAGVLFAQAFVAMTDAEFARSDGQGDAKGQPSFSVGVLITHSRAPVLFTMEFAEHQLLKWAKSARRARLARRPPGGAASEGAGGTLALYYAPSLDNVPSSLTETLERVFRRAGRETSPNGRSAGEVPYYLTLGPLTAKELDYLIRVALEHQGAQGPLRHLVEAWLRTHPAEAVLYALYQQERNPALQSLSKAFQLDGRTPPPEELQGLRLEGARLPHRPPLLPKDDAASAGWGATPGGWTSAESARWVPAWDLLQLMDVFPRLEVGAAQSGGGTPA